MTDGQMESAHVVELQFAAIAGLLMMQHWQDAEAYWYPERTRNGAKLFNSSR
jgi:hypothetical protein